MTDHASHWDTLYSNANPDEVSWYEDEPATSLRMVQSAAPSPGASLVDVGAGQSYLVDRLLEAGWTDVTVLDVSEEALSDVEKRLGESAGRATFLVRDVLDWEPDRRFDVWHDRAVFHFLTQGVERTQYVRTASGAVTPGGAVVLGVFAEDGPLQCSGLPTARYTADALASAFSQHFDLESAEREEHATPGGATQPLTWVRLRRR